MLFTQGAGVINGSGHNCLDQTNTGPCLVTKLFGVRKWIPKGRLVTSLFIRFYCDNDEYEHKALVLKVVSGDPQVSLREFQAVPS